MTISIDYFKNLSKEEKLKLVSFDKPVGLKEDPNYIYCVFQLSDFFVELQSEQDNWDEVAHVNQYSATEFIRKCIAANEYFICDPSFD